MADLPPSNGLNQSDEIRDATGSASLISVPASEQQQPGAIERCPVCGIPYALGGALVTEPQLEAQPADPEQARVVMRCSYCGTYSVGAPPAE